MVKSDVTISGIQGNSIKAETLGISQDGYVLTWINSNDEWEAKPTAQLVNWAGDLLGSTDGYQWVGSISGIGGAGGNISLNISSMTFVGAGSIVANADLTLTPGATPFGNNVNINGNVNFLGGFGAITTTGGADINFIPSSNRISLNGFSGPCTINFQSGGGTIETGSGDLNLNPNSGNINTAATAINFSSFGQITAAGGQILYLGGQEIRMYGSGISGTTTLNFQGGAGTITASGNIILAPSSGNIEIQGALYGGSGGPLQISATQMNFNNSANIAAGSGTLTLTVGTSPYIDIGNFITGGSGIQFLHFLNKSLLGTDSAGNIIDNSALYGSFINVVTSGGTTPGTNYTNLCNFSAADTMQAPDPTVVGTKFTTKDISGNASINNITIAPYHGGPDTFDGAANGLINANYGFVTYISDGTNWWSVAQ